VRVVIIIILRDARVSERTAFTCYARGTITEDRRRRPRARCAYNNNNNNNTHTDGGGCPGGGLRVRRDAWDGEADGPGNDPYQSSSRHRRRRRRRRRRSCRRRAPLMAAACASRHNQYVHNNPG